MIQKLMTEQEAKEEAARENASQFIKQYPDVAAEIKRTLNLGHGCPNCDYTEGRLAEIEDVLKNIQEQIAILLRRTIDIDSANSKLADLQEQMAGLTRHRKLNKTI